GPAAIRAGADKRSIVRREGLARLQYRISERCHGKNLRSCFQPAERRLSRGAKIARTLVAWPKVECACLRVRSIGGILKIEALILREIHVRLKSSFETSFGKIWERRILLVEACSDGLSGWGEVTAGEGPFYNPETTDTSWSIFCGFVAPLAIAKNIEAPGDVPALLAPIRGHEMTKAALENALWDIESQRRGTPLALLLGGTAREIACG